MYKFVSKDVEIIADDSALLYNRLKEENVISDLEGDPYEIYLLSKHWSSYDNFKNEAGKLDLDRIWDFIGRADVLTDSEIMSIILEQLDKVECILWDNGCIVLKNTKVSLLTRTWIDNIKSFVRGRKYEARRI